MEAASSGTISALFSGESASAPAFGTCAITATAFDGSERRYVRRILRRGMPTRRTKEYTISIGDRATSEKVASIRCHLPEHDMAVDLAIRRLLPERLTGRPWAGIADYRARRAARSGTSTAMSGLVWGEKEQGVALERITMSLDDNTPCDDLDAPDDGGIWVCVDRDPECEEGTWEEGWWNDAWSGECECLPGSPCHDPFDDDWPSHDDDDGPGSGGGGTGSDGPPPPPEDDDCLAEPDDPPCDAPGNVPQDYYDSLTRAEKLLCVSNPLGCLKTKEARDVAEAAAAASGLPTSLPRPGHNDAQDAYRHARWTAEMAIRVNPNWSKRFSDAHESESSAPCEVEMDLHNNQAGIDIAAANPSGGALDHLIKEWFRLGRLLVLEGEGENLSC